uniref:Solute carrier family 25 member 47 n=1 Tax=Strigops habroptila TaxID=2489341 RepID=A0A672UC47_STRHB
MLCPSLVGSVVWLSPAVHLVLDLETSSFQERSKPLFKCDGLKYHPLMLQVLFMAPSEVAKVRMQTQRNPHPSIASPQPVSRPKYRGSLHCLKVIAKQEGFGGLYKGCSALLCRDCFSSAIYFLTYSALCDWLTPAGKNKPDFLVVLLSGGFAGVLAWGFATPMDVIKSRMQTDESDQHKYKGLVHCVRESVRKEGAKVLFKGLGLNCIRAFPVNMVVFVTYECWWMRN